jgi:hypothetical protein
MNKECYEEFYEFRMLTSHLTFYEQNREEYNLMDSFLCDKYTLVNDQIVGKRLAACRLALLYIRHSSLQFMKCLSHQYEK